MCEKLSGVCGGGCLLILGRVNRGCGDYVWRVWGGCLESVGRLSRGCGEALYMVWGGCLEGLGRLYGRLEMLHRGYGECV